MGNTDETNRLEAEIFSAANFKYDPRLVRIATINLKTFMAEIAEASQWLGKEKEFAFQTGYLRKAGGLVRELLFNVELLGDYPKDALDQLLALSQKYSQKLIDDANINLDKGTVDGASLAIGEMVEVKKIYESRLFRDRAIEKPAGYAELVKRTRGEIKKYA